MTRCPRDHAGVAGADAFCSGRARLGCGSSPAQPKHRAQTFCEAREPLVARPQLQLTLAEAAHPPVNADRAQAAMSGSQLDEAGVTEAQALDRDSLSPWPSKFHAFSPP